MSLFGNILFDSIIFLNRRDLRRLTTNYAGYIDGRRLKFSIIQRLTVAFFDRLTVDGEPH